MSRRIAILLTSNDESAFARRFPNDGEKVSILLRTQRPDWRYRVWSVKDGEFPASTDADGYIITGSPASVHDSLDWITRLLALIRDLHARRVPLVGLCFGHQAIALALGGRVEISPGGWRMGIAATHFSKKLPWMAPYQPTLELYASHCEQVTQLPATAQRLGGDDFCPIASFAIEQHILTTQYHPEFSPTFMAELTEVLVRKLPVEVIAQAREELQREAQGEVFAQWMVNFLE